MRSARKLVLTAAMTVAAVALAASSASAQVEVSVEDGGHCPAVVLGTTDPLNPHTVTGGCPIRAASLTNAELRQHVAGAGEVLFSSCQNSFEARVDEAGAGYIYSQQLLGAACNIEPCDEAETAVRNQHVDLPWRVRLEEPAPNVEHLNVRFCTRQALADEGMGTECEVVIPVTEGTGALEHQYRFGPVSETPCTNLGGVVELSGSWTTIEDAAHPDVEIFH